MKRDAEQVGGNVDPKPSTRSGRRPAATWLAALLVAAGCSGGDAPGQDGGADDGRPDRTIPDDAGADEGENGGSDGETVSDEGLEHWPLSTYDYGRGGCGDGVWDTGLGEECDDGNRVNGDGCDWLCRVGDGDPPPPPLPGAIAYVPSGEPVEYDSGMEAGVSWGTLSVVWTGTEYVVAYWNRTGDLFQVRMCRFDRLGRLLGAEYRSEAYDLPGGLDLVWSGTELVLFFGRQGHGIFMQRFDPTLAPLGARVSVEADPYAYGLAAAVLTDGAFTLGWHIAIGSGELWQYLVRIRRVAADGSVAGLPLQVLSAASPTHHMDLAPGADGALLGVAEEVQEGRFRDSRTSVVLVSPAGEPERWVRFLGSVGPLGVGAAPDGFRAVWHNLDVTLEVGDIHLCVASLDRQARLRNPPVCTLIWEDVPGRVAAVQKVVSVDAGLGVALDAGGSLLVLSTDTAGTALLPFHQLMEPPDGVPMFIAQDFDIASSGHEFAVVYVGSWDNGPSVPRHLYFQRFVAAE